MDPPSLALAGPHRPGGLSQRREIEDQLSLLFAVQTQADDEASVQVESGKRYNAFDANTGHRAAAAILQ